MFITEQCSRPPQPKHTCIHYFSCQQRMHPSGSTSKSLY